MKESLKPLDPPPYSLFGGQPETMSEQEFKLIRDYLYEKAGIDMKPVKMTLIQNRLRKRLQKLGHATYTEYYQHLIKTPAELSVFLDALTTNETFFFREEKHWAFLKEKILAPLVKASPGGRGSFSLWSAASSTGEELHTAAIVLLESIPDPSKWILKLIGSDLNTEVLERAREGVYRDYAVRNIPKPLVTKYFETTKDEREHNLFKLKASVRTLCKFQQHNLQNPFPQKNFDLIMCRNVFIYFNTVMKERVMENLAAALAPGGHLFFSHTESLVPRIEELEYVQPSIFRKKK